MRLGTDNCAVARDRREDRHRAREHRARSALPATNTTTERSTHSRLVLRSVLCTRWSGVQKAERPHTRSVDFGVDFGD